MFDPAALARLAESHEQTLALIVRLEDRLNARFYRMETAVHGLMLAALTGESMVMIGPPGTAKSRLVRTFCNLIGLLDDSALAPQTGAEAAAETAHDRYFEYLLTQFTEPGELFGFFDLPQLFHPSQPRLAREDRNMMQRAQVVFLDEVFNASSAILNALLTFMNERKFHDRGQRIQTPLRLLFSATNHTPRDEGLGAVYDRFLLRCRLDNVAARPDAIADMVGRAWTETHATPLAGGGDDAGFHSLLTRLDAFRADVDAMTAAGALAVDAADPVFSRLADLVAEVRRKDLSQMSNRRLVKFTQVFLAEALLRGIREAAAGRPGPLRIGARDLHLLLTYGLDEEDPGTVARLRQHLDGTA